MSDDLTTFDPFDPETIQCPYPAYARMRHEAPVHHVERLGVHLVARHDLILQVLRDPQTYSSKFGGAGAPLPAGDRQRLLDVMAEGYPRVATMLTADQPEHTRYRRLVAKAFSPREIAALEPVVRAIAVDLIESWIDQDSIEFVEQFAVPLPVRVIARALNVPDSRLDDFKRWSDDSIAGIGTNLPIETRIAAERGVNEFQHYFAAQIEQRRTHPEDDLLTRLLNARIDDDTDIDDTRPLDMPEMLSIIQQLLVAGNETTTKLLTEMMRLMAQRPGEWDRVHDELGRADRIVEETLRLATPTQGMFRIVTRDTELGGVAIPAGGRVLLAYSSANRDESVWGDRPDDFDPDRDNLRDHLAFGKGLHYCLGAALARLEGRVALQELTARLAGYELADSNRYEYFPSFMLRGLTRLDLHITPSDVTTTG